MKPMIILSFVFFWAASVFSQEYTNIPRDGEGCMTDTIGAWQEHIINTGSPNVYFTSDVSQSFYLDENGVTIKCINCQPGDTGTVNGIRYEAVDKALLEQRHDEGADLTILKCCKHQQVALQPLRHKYLYFLIRPIISLQLNKRIL